MNEKQRIINDLNKILEDLKKEIIEKQNILNNHIDEYQVTNNIELEDI